MTNVELLAVLRLVQHNLEFIRPPPLQTVYLGNAKSNLIRATRDLEDRIKKNERFLR